MRKWFTKRIQPLLLVLALIAGLWSGDMVSVKAAETETLYELGETAVTAGQELSIPFTLKQTSEIDVNIFVKGASSVSVSVCDNDGKNVDWAKKAFTIQADQFTPVKSGYYGYVDTLSDVPIGDYIYKIVFTEDTSVMIGAYAAPVPAKMSQSKATITEGYTKKLYVNQGTVSSWKSSKKSVAKVDGTGKITAVKPGKTTITATMADGTRVACAVTVKANAFSNSRITTSDVKKNRCSMEAYRASFDDKGNLVVKFSFVNNTSHKITSLKNVRVDVKNLKGQTVGTYKASTLKITVSANSSKRLTVTIKKSDLKRKTADLRNSKITCEGKYVYKKS